MGEKRRDIRVSVQRGSNNNTYFEDYYVAVEPGQSVLGVLMYIAENIDPTLGFSCSCRIGLCSSCLVRINGKVKRSCTTLAEGDLKVEPYKTSKTIRDLITELPTIA